jgi:hypothetical protein
MGAVISLMLSGSTLYAGSRDGWIYSIKLGGDVILPKDIQVIDGIVKFKGYDPLSGGSNVIDLPLLLKVLNAKRK